MTLVKVELEIAAPPDAVWAVVMDPSRLREWVTIHRKLGAHDSAPLKRGSKVEQTLVLRGAPFKVRWTVTACEAPRRAVWEGKGPARSRARTTYRLTPADGGSATHFAYENEFDAPFGPLGAAAGKLLVGGISEREAAATMQRLKALVERG